jgi:hypothetical protein
MEIQFNNRNLAKYNNKKTRFLKKYVHILNLKIEEKNFTNFFETDIAVPGKGYNITT